MRKTNARGLAARFLAAGAIALATLVSGCAFSTASQQAAIRDRIAMVETGPNTISMTLEYRFYSGDAFEDVWPEEKARFVQRSFLLGVAEEARRRGKPGFRLSDLDGGWNSRGMSDGFRMYDVNTTVRMEASVTFLNAVPPGKEDGVYRTAEALRLFGA